MFTTPDSLFRKDSGAALAVRLAVVGLLAANAFAAAVVSAADGDAYTIPIQATRVSKALARRGVVSGELGLGNIADLIYSVPIRIGSTVVPLQIDTGSSDVWVVSDECRTQACEQGSPVRYPYSSQQATGVHVQMSYGDSVVGGSASGDILIDTATVAGIAMLDQPFALINNTNNGVVQAGLSGLFGMGFPLSSKVQEALTLNKTGTLTPTDSLIASTYTDAPLLSRITMTGELEMPMFTVTLQRSTIDIEGDGLLTVGRLPPGIDNSTITWIPVRRYTAGEGGRPSPTFAPDEVYPSRWEIDLDAVYLNGVKLPASSIPANGEMDSDRMSALIDTGNSLLRGPADVVRNIRAAMSPDYDPDASESVPLFPCTTPQTLTFEIGGKLFPIDPRDLIDQVAYGNSENCTADNIEYTDPPRIGALYRWSLGTPFFRSNLVAFHYGNLTHPSVDPPRIGIRSLVPANANDLLLQAVADARGSGGNFEQTLEPPPPAHLATTTVSTAAPFSLTTTYTLSLGATSIAAAPEASATAERPQEKGGGEGEGEGGEHSAADNSGDADDQEEEDESGTVPLRASATWTLTPCVVSAVLLLLSCIIN